MYALIRHIYIAYVRVSVLYRRSIVKSRIVDRESSFPVRSYSVTDLFLFVRSHRLANSRIQAAFNNSTKLEAEESETRASDDGDDGLADRREERHRGPKRGNAQDEPGVRANYALPREGNPRVIAKKLRARESLLYEASSSHSSSFLFFIVVLVRSYLSLSVGLVFLREVPRTRARPTVRRASQFDGNEIIAARMRREDEYATG